MKQNLSKRIKNVSIDLIKDSTSHGLPRIFKSDRVLIKLMWLICFLAGNAACGFLIYLTISDYLSFDVTTVIRVTPEIPMQFPAVSICNSNLFTTNKSYEFFQEILSNNSISDILNSSILNTYFASRYQIKQNYDILYYMSLLNALDSKLANEIKKNFSYSLDDILISCFFAGSACNMNNIVWYFDPTFGNCYKFNSGFNSSGHKIDILNQSKIGYYNGLRIELMNRVDKHKINVNTVNGFQVTVYDPKTNPNSLKSAHVSTGAQTSIVINKIINKRLSKPFSDCTNDYSEYSNSDIFKATINYNKVYTRDICLNACFQDNLIKRCNCSDPTNPFLYDVRTCSNITDIICDYISFIELFTKKNIFKECENSCPLECEETMFEYKISNVKYPSEQYAEVLMKLEQDKNPNSKMTIAELKENVLSFNLFYDSLNYKRIEELEKTGIIDLISNIGGIMGLFLGVSFLSFAELFEFIIEIFYIIKEYKFEQRIRIKKIQIQTIS